MIKYVFPKTFYESHKSWRGSEGFAFSPNPQQQQLMDTVRHLTKPKAKGGEGIFYNVDINKAIRTLDWFDGAEADALSEATYKRGESRVENGIGGMEIYYARCVAREQDRIAKAKALGIIPGRPWVDVTIGKRTYKQCKIINPVDYEGRVVLTGIYRKRGYEIKIMPDALPLMPPLIP